MDTPDTGASRVMQGVPWRSRRGNLWCGVLAVVLALANGSTRAEDAAHRGEYARGASSAQVKLLLAKGSVKDEPEAKDSQSSARKKAKARSADPVPTEPTADRSKARMDECRQQVSSAFHPAQVMKFAEACERDLPFDPYASELKQLSLGARQVLEIQRSSGLSTDLFDDPVGDQHHRENVRLAGRGDKEAAYRIAVAYRAGTSGVSASERRMEQWLRFSAELGNGMASWELAEFYNYRGLVADAARFEKKAVELGYRVPVRLPTRPYGY